MGPYTVCPLSFWFLFAAFLNEKLDDYEIFFKVLFLQHLQSPFLVFFFSFSPQKETQSLYNLSMFALLEMGKLMLNALLVLLSPEQGGLMTFSCRVACFRKPRRLLSVPEVAFPEAHILAPLTAQTETSY